MQTIVKFKNCCRITSGAFIAHLLNLWSDGKIYPRLVLLTSLWENGTTSNRVHWIASIWPPLAQWHTTSNDVCKTWNGPCLLHLGSLIHGGSFEEYYCHIRSPRIFRHSLRREMNSEYLLTLLIFCPCTLKVALSWIPITNEFGFRTMILNPLQMHNAPRDTYIGSEGATWCAWPIELEILIDNTVPFRTWLIHIMLHQLVCACSIR